MIDSIRFKLFLTVVGIASAIIFFIPFIALIAAVPYIKFIEVMSLQDVRASLMLSILTASASTAISLILGIGIAYILAFKNFPMKDLVSTLITLPMVLPPSAAGYILLLTFGRFGLAGRPLFELFGVSVMFTIYAIILAQIFVVTPFVVTATKTGFLEVKSNYINAASTLGASQSQIFLLIIIPLAKKSVLAGGLLAFARAIGEFGASVMVSGILSTMPIEIFRSAAAGRQDIANFISLLLIVVSFSFLYLFNRLLKVKK